MIPLKQLVTQQKDDLILLFRLLLRLLNASIPFQVHIQQKYKKDSSERGDSFSNQPGAKVTATFGCKCEENGKRK